MISENENLRRDDINNEIKTDQALEENTNSNNDKENKTDTNLHKPYQILISQGAEAV